MNIGSSISKGARRAVSGRALGTVAGLAGSRLVEVAAYKASESTFGLNDGSVELTRSHKMARSALKVAGIVLAAGMLMGNKNEAAAGVGAGLVAGWTWHLLNDFGVNV